jgi:hypothetical protein
MICKICHYHVYRRWFGRWGWKHGNHQEWREFGWHRVKPGVGSVRLSKAQWALVNKLMKSQVRGVDSPD